MARRVNRSANVDETLFGKTGARGPNRGVSKEVIIVGKDTVQVRKKEGNAVNRGPPRCGAVVIDTFELDRLRDSARLASGEEVGQKERLEEVRRLQMEKNVARKEKIGQIDEERRMKEIAVGADPAIRAQRNNILERAKQKLDEERGEVKQMSQMVLSSKVFAIRDVQMQEKRDLEKEKEAEERRLDEKVEAERLKTLKMFEQREKDRQEAQRGGAKVIAEQMRDRQLQRICDEDQRDQERELAVKQMEAAKQQEAAQQQQKSLAAERLRIEVNKSNEASRTVKEEALRLAKLEDQKVLDYQREQDERNRQIEAEKARLAAERGHEAARLCAMQEKTHDKSAEVDAKRAQRAALGAERAAREREAQDRAKQEMINCEMAEARRSQQAEKERHHTEQLRLDGEEHRRIIQVQEEQLAAEKRKQAAEKATMLKHCEELKGQVATKEHIAAQERRTYLEAGIAARAKLSSEKKDLDDIKARKLEELKKAGVPEKYIVDLERKKVVV